MSQFVPGLEATPNKRLLKVRELPISGEILVSVGQTVKSDTIVAQAHLPGDLQILRIPEKVGIEPFEAVAGLERQKVHEGQRIEQGQLICEHAGLFGLFRSRYFSPEAGTIEFISKTNGHVGLRLAPNLIQRDAFISGVVTAFDKGKSVSIESQAAFIQGIFGVGGEKRGVLRLLPVAADQPLREANLAGVDAKGAVLVGGVQPDLTFLLAASKAGAVGLITGSLDDEALTGFLGYDLGVALTGDEELSMTVIMTEGFGKISISKRILDIFQQFEGREVSINGATQVRAGAIRPEIIICHSGDVQVNSNALSHGLDVGSRIRIIRVPYFGMRATVSAMPHDLFTIDTGAQCRVLKARLDDGREVVVPRANVEIIDS